MYGERRTVSIETAEIRSAGSEEWKGIKFGDSWEPVLGIDFDGKATYRFKLPEAPKSERYFLQFDGVATKAQLSIDGKVISEHLGCWTPWRVEITEHYRAQEEVRLEVDELVGHNTQGFLPVFLPHFGGVWKGVSLIATSNAIIDDHKLYHASRDLKSIHFEIPFHAGNTDGNANKNPNDSDSDANYQVLIRDVTAYKTKPGAVAENGTVTESTPLVAKNIRPGVASLDFQPAVVRPWTPQDPFLYVFDIELKNLRTGQIEDRIQVRAGLRTATADGRKLLLNGQPITVRGVLNWGYAPPRLAPSIDRDWMRKEIELAKDMGFNLMKFCLWLPPQDYLDLCDELGMLAWVEYPTWHPKLDAKHLAELRVEYEEFFHYDRNHPSVLLRSLTCETGHSAELAVIQSLYDRGHELIPGSLIEDDSSWITWNRVHDFYDDHPYGNNHTWSKTLQGFEEFIQQRQAKPLVLGEAIAADTWTNPSEIPSQDHYRSNPFALRSNDKTEAYLDQVREWCGPNSVKRIAVDAKRNAIAMRRFQIEKYRVQLPQQGYVVSVLRDFPFASMGLIDFRGKPKWSSEEWNWHGERMAILQTQGDARSLLVGELKEVVVREIDGQGSLELADTSKIFVSSDNPPFVKPMSLASDDLSKVKISDPIPAQIHFSSNHLKSTSKWPVWLLPSRETWEQPHYYAIHSSVDKNDPRLADWNRRSQTAAKVIVAQHFDEALMKELEAGANILMLPDGKPGSFPINDHWFLRGGILLGDQTSLEPPLLDMISDLHEFDLAGPVIRQPDYLDEVTPIALLWDNHDIDHYRTHAMAFATTFGKGRLLVSTFNHDPARGPAASYLLNRFGKLLASDAPLRALSSATRKRMSDDLSMELTELPRGGWKFQADKENRGLELGWQKPGFDSSKWSDIEIAKHWDGQGHGAIDGWAWYLRDVEIPAGTKYVTLTGADDYAELFVDGELCGSVGDRVLKKTAFEQTLSIPIPTTAAGRKVRVAFRVEDWQGAGGIFRPVFLGNQPFSEKGSILVRKVGSR